MTDSDTATEPAAVDVVCLASSGASPREFVQWQSAAGAACRIVPMDLPGRGRKARQTPAKTLDALVGRLLHDLPTRREYALFGHSLGGLLAYELARRVAVEGLPLPRFVVVAACRPPHEISSPLFTEAAERSDGEVLDALDAADLISGTLRASPAAGLIVPALRADLRLLAGYLPPQPGEAAVPVDIAAWYGVADRAVPESTAARWRPYTSRTWSLSAFRGGHFFVRDDWNACVGALVELVESHGARAARAPERGPRAVPEPIGGRSADHRSRGA